MLEISYKVIIEIYNKLNPEQAKPEWIDGDLRDI
jgi:hypothetical protein